MDRDRGRDRRFVLPSSQLFAPFFSVSPWTSSSTTTTTTTTSSAEKSEISKMVKSWTLPEFSDQSKSSGPEASRSALRTIWV